MQPKTMGHRFKLDPPRYWSGGSAGRDYNMKPNLDFKHKGTQVSEVQDGRIAPSIHYAHSERGRSMAYNELPHCIQYININRL